MKRHGRKGKRSQRKESTTRTEFHEACSLLSYRLMHWLATGKRRLEIPTKVDKKEWPEKGNWYKTIFQTVDTKTTGSDDVFYNT